MASINVYGDQLVSTATGHGADISTQRADDLDVMAIELIRSTVPSAPVVALDVGCGHGGQAARMAKAGARVVAMDAMDYRAQMSESMARDGVPADRWGFYHAPVEDRPHIGTFDIVVCQRMIHYLTHSAARSVLDWFYEITNSGGRLFLSASGLHSELGEGYAAGGLSVQERFALLSPAMAEKHAIRQPVCLYRMSELADLVNAAGWVVETAFISPFGNVKLVGSKP